MITPNSHSTNVEQFLSGLIQLKGFSDISDDAREAMIADLRERLDEYIMTKTVAQLSDDDVMTFEKMLDDDTPFAEIQQFAQDHIPDYDAFLASTLLEFQDAYLIKKEEQS